MPELIVASTGHSFGEADVHDIRVLTLSGEAEQVDSVSNLPVTPFSGENRLDVNSNLPSGRLSTNSHITAFVVGNNLKNTDTTYTTVSSGLFPIDVSLNYDKPNNLYPLDTGYTSLHSNILPFIDKCWDFEYRTVNRFFNKPIPPADNKYLPSTDFSIGDEVIGFTGDFSEPLDFDKIKTVLSPVDNLSSKLWDRTKNVDVEKSLKYGYSINNFLVGGDTRNGYLIDEDATEPPEPPVDPTVTGEVINIVNIINVVTLPERTPIEFTNFTLARDLDSVAWVVNFDIATAASLALVKPVGLNTKELEIDINGQKFNVFIGRTSTSASVDDKGKVTRRIKCTGWSNSKLLSFPYHPKRSYTETSSSTPSGILSTELASAGFTGTWSSVSWTIPANLYSYFDKAPLAAIADLASAVGAVIVPDNDGKGITVKPRYPISPWGWDTATVDYTLAESQFFTMDTDWVPQESPDSIYVYGEENSGVAVKCVKSGTAGLVTLPTVVNKYITDTVAGTERGRIEVCKAGFKEIIPVSTYVDGNGIIEPQSLIEVIDLVGGTWRGMVISTSLNIKRNGNAIVQSLQIERYYE